MADYLVNTVAYLLLALMNMPVKYGKDIVFWTCV